MQSYALSREIQKRYPSKKVEIIDFELLTKHESYRRPLSLKRLNLGVEYWFKYRAFQNDLGKLPLSSKTFITNNHDVLIDYVRKEYEVIIVGSDAVWAYQKMYLNNPFWLFGDKLRDIVKMSYAASAYSTDFKNVPNDHKMYIADMLTDFEYIGVRDQETYNFIKDIKPEKQIFLNCDPTFLLPKGENINRAKKILRNNFINPKRPLISFMTTAMPYINEVKKHLGNSFTFVHFSHRDRNMDIFKKNTRLLINLSPTDWYNLYCKCTLNFSNYFHGSLLGVRNSVPTISIDKTNFLYPYIGKIQQVMTDLKLEDYFFLYKNLRQENEKDRLFSQIDYSLKYRESESLRIENAANKEMEKAESFFEALSKYI